MVFSVWRDLPPNSHSVQKSREPVARLSASEPVAGAPSADTVCVNRYRVSVPFPVFLWPHRGRAAAQGAAVLPCFGSRDFSIERHGFEFWCLCLFLGIFWPLLRAMARAAGMQERSMGRSLLQRKDCSGSCRPGALNFRGEDGRALAQGAKRRGERRGGGKKPWQLQSGLRHGVAFGTVVSLRDPGVASQSPFASRFADPRRVSPHPQQFLNISGRKSLQDQEVATHALPRISLTSCTEAPSACSEPVALQPARLILALCRVCCSC